MTVADSISRRTVCFLDILGFSEMVQRTPLAEMVKTYEKLLLGAEFFNKKLPLRHNEPQLFKDHPRDMPYCIKYVFSDSIILVAHDDNLESCLKLITYAWRLVQHFLANQISIRGGISYNDMYINLDTSIFLGRGLTEAYALEQKQNWIGVSIDNSVWIAYPQFLKAPLISFSDTICPEYAVPMKSGSETSMRILNWRYNFIVENGTRWLFVKSDDPSAQQKISNTLSYAQWVINSGRVYHKDQAACPVELRAYSVGESEPPFLHGDEL